MRRVVVRTIISAALLLAGACGSNDDDEGRTAAVYAAIIEELVPPPPDAAPDAPIETDVFVWGGEDRTIPLDVQVGTVQALDGYTSIRFVDDRDEAVDVEQPGEPVRNEGVLITLGPVPPTGGDIEVAVTFETDSEPRSFDVHLEGGAAGWTITQLPPLPR